MPELTRRYIVMAMATEGPFDVNDTENAFVLKPWKDPAALHALQTYRDHCYPELATEIDAWIKVIGSGPVVRGGVGVRNERHLASRPKPGEKRGAKPARSRSRNRSKAPMKVAERKAARKKAKRRR
jgi:hypothetical protein